ncbi:MAG: hypothetical protein LBT05_10370 [Planctomycetaceae bacterium]|jgi:hypothetical protein|nr:hypothetical protein [Planctomycetaceae bacterium]
MFRNHLTTVEKQTAFQALRLFFRMFIYALLGNPAVPDESLASMSIRPRTRAAKLPTSTPTEVPVVSAVVGQHHDVTFYVAKPQLGRPAEFLKNPKYYGFILKYKLENESEWKQLVSTKLRHTMIFDEQ